MKGILALLLAGALAGGCAGQGGAAPAPARPKLVVLLIADGLSQRQLVDYREQLAPDGLARFLDRGAWFAEAHYGHAYTVTCPGHAVIATGAYPHRTGIIGNGWRGPATGAIENCVGDPAHHYLGPDRGAQGTSPRNLRVETFGDALRAASPASKVIAVSGKDRGAILPAGHKGTAYVYGSATGQFDSTTYYMAQLPKWVADFNAARPADRYFRAEWKPLLPATAYARSLADGQRWFPPGGALPRTIGAGDKPTAAFYDQLFETPFFDRLLLDFARAAIDGEALGRDDAPDVLSVSLSALDSVNHAFGAESRLSHDHVLHLDRALQDFFRDLDAKVGRDNYAAVLTSDHGFMPAPEYSASLGLRSGRQHPAQMLARMNRALASKYGRGEWVRSFSASAVVLNPATMMVASADPRAVAEDVRLLLLDEPAVAAAYTRAQILARSAQGQPYFEQVVRTWHRDISGDVEFVLRPYWMLSSGGTGTTHGSPHPYDTHVPVAFYGPAWIRAGRRDGRVEVADIAPTIAGLLGVPPPSASEGRALPLR